MHRLKLLGQLTRYFGIKWVLFRAWYALQKKLGLLRRRMTPYAWRDRPLRYWLRATVPSDPLAYVEWRREHGGRFFFTDLPPASVSAIEEAERILGGEWRYFGHQLMTVGFPPDWHLNPFTGSRLPADRHWTTISDAGESGDIKLVWEASRFAVVYTLARAYAASHDERYPAAFWKLVEDWAAHNPPMWGPNWGCGQEATFRLMAWCFGLYAFRGAPHTTPERVATLAAIIAAHADRIEQNINFARSQNNNHGVSEGVGLWTVGLLFPEFARAARWREHGRRVIETEVGRQVFDDGSYAQYSLNYQRVMLHDCLWALRLGEVNGRLLSRGVYDRVGRAADFLYGLLDVASGQVPNHGSNDSTLVLPLNACDVTDFRPVLQAVQYLLHEDYRFAPGPWDEDIRWLFAAPAANTATTNNVSPTLSAHIGGYYTLRSDQSWVMIRCTPHRVRPHHADQLHLDLWWRGLNIACDAGTYLYSGAPPWDNGLMGTAVHNTVTVDGQDQMTRAGRFLWLDWSRGHVLHHEDARWEGTHDGYTGVSHRRRVMRLDGDAWLVVDWIESATVHEYMLHWLLPDFPYAQDDEQLILHTPAGDYYVHSSATQPAGRSIIRGSDHQRGWRSLYYGDKEAALSLALSARTTAIVFRTLFSPVNMADGKLHINGV